MSNKRLSLKCEEEQVELEGEDGSIRLIVIRGLTSEERDIHGHQLQSKLRFGPDGKVQGLKDPRDVKSMLLEMCLSEDGKKLQRKEINKWPVQAVDYLHQQAQKLSGLNDDAAEEAGNDSGATV